MTTTAPEKTTTFTSPIQLGQEYRDERTGIEGYAVTVCFQEHGCVEISLEYVKDGEPKRVLINELRLTTAKGEDPKNFDVHVYSTNLVLGHHYEDIQTGLKGHLAMVEFHENINARGILRVPIENKKGKVDNYRYASIDDFLLKDLTVKAEKPADQQTRRSPVSHTRPAR